MDVFPLSRFGSEPKGEITQRCFILEMENSSEYGMAAMNATLAYNHCDFRSEHFQVHLSSQGFIVKPVAAGRRREL
jgi:hypothetical protein